VAQENTKDGLGGVTSVSLAKRDNPYVFWSQNKVEKKAEGKRGKTCQRNIGGAFSGMEEMKKIREIEKSEKGWSFGKKKEPKKGRNKWGRGSEDVLRGGRSRSENTQDFHPGACRGSKGIKGKHHYLVMKEGCAACPRKRLRHHFTAADIDPKVGGRGL